MTDGIGDAEFFLTLADAGGVGAGAAAMHSSPPAASRRLAAIERRLGVRLAERSARRFRLTDEGRLYYDRARALVAALRDMEAEVSSRGAIARGMLHVAAPTDLGRHHIAPALDAFSRAHPDLAVHLVLSDVGAEVAEDGLDIAVRTGLPADPAVIARRLAGAPMVLCAAPSYAAANGLPETLEQLAGHRCLTLARRHHHRERWLYRDRDGIMAEARVAGMLSSSSGDVLRQWALAGAGLSLEAMWDVSADLAAGRLVACLTDVAWQEATLYATFLPGSPLPPRVRLAVDWLVRIFSDLA